MITAAHHAILEDNGTTFRCRNCGQMLQMGLPCELSLWTTVATAFDEAHRTCTPWTPNPERRGPWSDPSKATAAAAPLGG